MRKIGITLWVVAIIVAAGLSAVLLRTNLLAGPPDRPSSAGSTNRAGSPPTTGAAPTTAPSGPPASAATAPTTLPSDPSPSTTSPGDLYQALRSAAQQLIGNGDRDHANGSDSHDFSAWYQRLEAAYGGPLPADVAFDWFTQLFGHRDVSNGQADGANALVCLAGGFPSRTCPAGVGDGG
jgi:hypothetical protein